MIVEGLKLMVVGMTTVLLFLTFMILLIQAAAKLTKDVTARELQAIENEKAKYDDLWSGADSDAFRWLLAKQILQLQEV